ncbi:MAG: phosphatase PAP2 family protein [Candidatus Eremiobacteraeota bacterium]|nr:phosphatase PAP2 family protein [Candidatus Eremiobacteraeota bacterium]
MTYWLSRTSVIATSVAACAAVAVITGHAVAEGETRRRDGAILEAIHRHSSPLLDHVFALVTFMGGPGVVAVAAALVAYVFLRHGRRDAAVMAGGMIVAEVLDLVLKELFDRVRPDLWLRTAVSGESFPSGHALASTVIYGLVAWTLARRWPGHEVLIGASATFVVAAIAFSRLYLGVHWPSDVVAGVAIGYLCLIATIQLVRRSSVRARVRR